MEDTRDMILNQKYIISESSEHSTVYVHTYLKGSVRVYHSIFPLPKIKSYVISFDPPKNGYFGYSYSYGTPEEILNLRNLEIIHKSCQKDAIGY